ncbi:DUF3558 family protein [Pseudonocardia abyssalis]|uniref:DUF3558 family protein n=1 Tax=Pseudonocardia abyssalis TaxID=2792008 RepID=A0ABS6V1C3_9PSEU|nr:DUF3558 family protein [Pseudonocardia abyssalis]MBW0116701.1 DUF3558 family protein [Pseudonocardia abyssalis]MBW0137908.1 DUF3558 family protein [Pseudonocardia abyssalis]
MGRMWSAGALAVGLTLLTACSAPSTTPGVPPVENPRDVRGLDACAVPDGAALAAAGVGGTGTAGVGPEGPRCEWRGPAGQLLTVTVFTGDGGLATLASNSEPTTTRVRLAGYPALETFTGSGEFCQYDIGVAADQVLLVSLDGGALDGGAPDSCTALQSLLPPVLAALPG